MQVLLLSVLTTGSLEAPLYFMDNNWPPRSNLCNIRSQMEAVYVLIDMDVYLTQTTCGGHSYMLLGVDHCAIIISLEQYSFYNGSVLYQINKMIHTDTDIHET
jgi:hypothetical protein